MISRETISQIVDTARIDEVIGDFVHLKRAGANLKGNCPFHDEKTPSFVVSPAKNIYKCFGCGAAGDSIKFLMEHEGINYPEALRYLAEKYRIEIIEEFSENYDAEEAQAKQSHKDSVFIAMKYAAQFYQENLLETDEGKTIGLSYFKHRGFLQQTIEKFMLGYAPEGFNNFLNAALKSGFEQEVLESAGLIRVREGKNAYDFFRARVMFPIHNLSGRVVAFGGRIMGQDVKVAKYINTPETPIYTKGQLLYGIYQAKDSMRRLDTCYLVEGYTDVLGLHQSGIENVVASSGTALTQEQVKLISRFTKNIVLIYDGDQAGINAALRGVDIMLELDMNVEVVLLPDGDDPDSFVRKQGTDATIEYIEKQKKDFIFFKSDVLLKDVGSDPTLKAQAVRGIVESIALIEDQIRRAFYIRECSKLVDLSEDLLITEVNKYMAQLHKQKQRQNRGQAEPDIMTVPPEFVEHKSTAQTPGHKQPDIYHQEKDVLRVMLLHGDKVMPEEEVTVLNFVKSQIGGVKFKHETYNKMLQFIFQAIEQNKDFEEIQDENSYSEEDLKSLVIGMKISPYELSPNWEKQHNIIVKESDMVWENDVYSTINRYILHAIKLQLMEIDQQIKNTPSDNFERCMELMEQKMLLQNPKIDIAKKFGSIII